MTRGTVERNVTKTRDQAVPPPHRQQAALVEERLRGAMPTPRIELDYTSPWQLLIATILSAQSTDTTVNRIARELFERFPTPEALAAAPQEEVEAIIR